MGLSLTIPDPNLPPEVDLLALIEHMMEDCHKKGLSPVRYLQLEREKHVEGKVPGRWRPNRLRACRRAQIYKALRIPRVYSPFDRRQQFIFDRGNVFGAWFAAYCKALEEVDGNGVSLVATELECSDPQTEVGGKLDVIMRVGSHLYIAECKSKENEKAITDLKAPDQEHVAQLNDYMAMTGAKAGWVVYFGIWMDGDKTSIKIKTFFHRFDPKLWESTKQTVRTLEWFLNDHTKLAPKTDKKYFECPSCPWKGVCDMELSPLAARAFLERNQ